MIDYIDLTNNLEMIDQPLNSNRSWMLVASVIGFVMVALISGYSAIRSSSLEKKLVELKAEKERIIAEALAQVDANDTRATLLAIKDKLANIESTQLLWSDIIEKIEKTIPVSAVSQSPLINLRSYNGTAEGDISLSATTRGDSLDGFNDIAYLIRAFVAEPSFKEVFIPSITKNITPEGQAVLSFTMHLAFQKQTF